jgi:hypothetical protein
LRPRGWPSRFPSPRRISALDADKKPNIIYILAEDLDYRDLGCNGQKLIKAAKGGIRRIDG